MKNSENFRAGRLQSRNFAHCSNFPPNSIGKNCENENRKNLRKNLNVLPLAVTDWASLADRSVRCPCVALAHFSTLSDCVHLLIIDLSSVVVDENIYMEVSHDCSDPVEWREEEN